MDETQTWVAGGDFNELAKNFEANLSANGVQMPALLEDELEQRICAQSPPDWQGCGMSGGERNVSRGDVKRWLTTMIANAKSDDYVTQEEAERRADICRQCRFRVDPTGCFGCGGLVDLLLKLLSGRSVPNPENLKFCGVCGCDNSRQVFFPLPVLQSASAGLTYPEDVRLDPQQAPLPCWKR